MYKYTVLPARVRGMYLHTCTSSGTDRDPGVATEQIWCMGLYEHGVAIATPAYAYTHVHLIPACVHVYGMYLLYKCCMELKLKIPRRRCLLLLLPCMPLRAPLTRASTLYSLSVYSMQMRAGKRAAHGEKSFASLVSALICVPPLQSLEAQVVAAIDI